MCMNWKNVLVHMIIFAVGLQCCVFADGASECHILTDNSKGQYFYGFDALPITNKFTHGCATNGSVSMKNKTYKENFIFNVQNDRAADIYLNINGISHRTMNTLPHYNEYKYEFALISKKDVVWIFSTENMPNSSVDYKFYVSGGSLVLSQNGLKLPFTKVDKNFHGSQDILGWFKDNRIFTEPNVSSISEFVVERVAAVNVLTGFGKTPLKQGQSKFTKCVKVQENYVSPIIALQNFTTHSPDHVCQRSIKTPLNSNHANRAFILEMDYVTAEENNRSVKLEIVGNKETGDFQGKTVIVLRSPESVNWQIRIAENLRSNKYLFVIGKRDRLELVDSVPNTINRNPNYDGDDFSALSKSIKSLYDCNIISHAKYSLPLDLIFLRLSRDQQKISDSLPSDMREVADYIYGESNSWCEEDSLCLDVPSFLLKQYGLSEKNFKIGSDDSTCDHFLSRDGLEYTLTMCCDTKDSFQETEMTVILNSASDHFYTLPDRETTSQFSYTLICKPNDENNNFNEGEIIEILIPSVYNNTRPSTMECTGEKLTISIPESRTHQLDLSSISDCKTMSYRDDGDLKYTMTNNEKDNCGAVFKDNSCQLLLPLKNTGKDADRDDIVEFFCRDSTLIESLKYQFGVFEDFNLKKRVIFPKTVYLNTQSDENDADTFHVTVSVVSEDPSLSVYISECVLWSGSTHRKTLIKNNCPADESLSFVRPYGGSHKQSQHFVVQMNEFLRKYKNVELKCDVGACTTELQGAYCVPTIPQCFHLHGDACSRTDHHSNLKFGTIREERVATGQFYVSEKNDLPTAGAPPNKNTESDSGLSSPGVITLLVLGCFLVGAGFVSGLWWIDKKSYSKSSRNSKITDCDNSGESGRSRSTGSTKLSGSSLSSLLCNKNRKETASPSSSKDDLELKSLINSTHSPTSHSEPLPNGTTLPVKNSLEKRFVMKGQCDAVENVYEVSPMGGFRVTAETPTKVLRLSPGAGTSVPHPKHQISSTSTTDPCCAITQKEVVIQTPCAGHSSACNTSLSTDSKSHLKYIPPSQAMIPSTSNSVLKWPNATLRSDEKKLHLNSNTPPFSKDEFDKLKEVDL